jgi:hypothetical protein
MRVRPFGLSLAAFVALNAAQTTADTIPPSLHLARVSGVTLVVNPIGTKPCDFNLGRLTTDIEFVLNSGMINFDSSETAGENGWPPSGQYCFERNCQRMHMDDGGWPLRSAGLRGCAWIAIQRLHQSVERENLWDGTR